MKRWLSLLLIICQTASAQYYFKDILNIQQTSEELSAYKKAGVRKIKMESFEKDDSPAAGFRCEKKIAKDYLSSILQTKLPEIGYTILTTNYNNNLLPIRVIDSSELSVSEIQFNYSTNGQLIYCQSYTHSADDDYINEHREEHLYIYNEKGQPSQMKLVKNKTDTTIILFSIDNSGHVELEKDTRTGGKYYYYYNNEGRLTDIVHSSEYTRELLPDYVFDYFETGEPAKITSFENSGKGKTTIRYEYDDGLKKTEYIYINGQYGGKMVYGYSR